jgi:hypothetical protein
VRSPRCSSFPDDRCCVACAYWDDRLALLTIRLLGSALDGYARREHLYSDKQAADEELQTDRRTLVPVVIAYLVAIGIGLALPTLAVVLYFALAVFLVVPFRDLRDLRGLVVRHR